jgi:hypothetical protein
MKGWVKVHRKLSEKVFYRKDSEKVHLWIHLLICANRDEREELLGGKLIKCNSGQFTTGRKQLSEATGINESKIERILTYFEKIEQQIEQQKTSTNRLISILNWSEYQSTEQQSEQQVNNDRTTSEQRVNTLKEVKEVKEIKNNREYKNILLSKIDIFDFPELKFEYLEIALSFQELFRANLTEAKASTATVEKAKGSWIDDIRMMVEIDKVKIEDLREIFKFLKKDQFWKQNILSTKKLREKYPQLKMKINGESKQTTEFASKKQSGNRVTDAYKQRIVERILAGKPDEDLQNK